MRPSALLSFGASILMAPAAWACAFHGYTPQPTLVDRLLGSEHSVLARNSVDDPFRYRATEAIEGQIEYVAIPDLVDTKTRRRFAKDDDAMVLFARDGAYGPWLRLAYIDADFEPVLDEIVERLPEWEIGGDFDRYQFFADLLDHPNPDVHALALRELDQAEYGALRHLDLDIPVARLVSRLNQPAEMGLNPIRVLLLGLAGEQAPEEYLAAGLEAHAGVGSTILGAYATAYLELLGPEAVKRITKHLLPLAADSSDARELLVEALAIHGTSGAPDTIASVTVAVEQALRDDASLAPSVARHFGTRADWSFETPLADILRAQTLTSITDVLVVTQYVAIASEAIPAQQ